MGLPAFKGGQFGEDPAPLDQRRGGQINAVQEQQTVFKGSQLGEGPAPLDQRRGGQIKAVQEQQIEGLVEHAGRVACRTTTALLCIQLGGIASVIAGLFWFEPMVGAIATAAIAFIAIDLIWISEYWPSNSEDEE